MAKIKGSALNPNTAEEINRARALMVQPGSEEFVAAQRQRRKESPIPPEMRRHFRNMQRSVVRDIDNTRKAMDKTTDAREHGNLEYRLLALEEIRHAMLSSWVDAQGHRHYNIATARIEAMQDYMIDFKGATALKEQRLFPRRLVLSEGQQVFRERAAKLIGYVDDGDSPFSATPMYRDLMVDLERAVRNYDSAQVKHVMAKIMHGREAFESNRRQKLYR